jgi:hypothetical protein
MPKIVTAKRLAGIKAQANISGLSCEVWRGQDLMCASADILDLVATLERAVELLHRQNQEPQSLKVFQDIDAFLFDHD